MSDTPSRRAYTRPPSSKSKSAPEPKTEWSALARFGVLMLWAASLAAAGFGLNYADRAAMRQVTAATRIEWVNKPAWLESSEWSPILVELENIPELYPDTNIFDDNVCSYVASFLVNSPWIKRLERVSKTNEGKIRVYATFRRPFSLVEAGNTAYMIDDEAVRLPWQTPKNVIDHEKWMTIRGVREGLPAIGSRWEGIDIIDGIKLLNWLNRRFDQTNPPAIRKMLTAVSVRNHDRKKSPWSGMLQLITANPRVYVDWGMPPLEEFPIEAAADLKLAHLLLPEAVRYLSDGTSINIRGERLAPVQTRPEYPTD